MNDVELYELEIRYLPNNPNHKSDGWNDWEATLIFPEESCRGHEIIGRGVSRYQAIAQATSGLDLLPKEPTEAEVVA